MIISISIRSYLVSAFQLSHQVTYPRHHFVIVHKITHFHTEIVRISCLSTFSALVGLQTTAFVQTGSE